MFSSHLPVPSSHSEPNRTSPFASTGPLLAMRTSGSTTPPRAFSGIRISFSASSPLQDSFQLPRSLSGDRWCYFCRIIAIKGLLPPWIGGCFGGFGSFGGVRCFDRWGIGGWKWILLVGFRAGWWCRFVFPFRGGALGRLFCFLSVLSAGFCLVAAVVPLVIKPNSTEFPFNSTFPTAPPADFPPFHQTTALTSSFTFNSADQFN